MGVAECTGGLDGMELTVSNDMVDSLWYGLRDKEITWMSLWEPTEAAQPGR